eukprot:PhF_6_TR21719/c0_g1_i1/m.31031
MVRRGRGLTTLLRGITKNHHWLPFVNSVDGHLRDDILQSLIDLSAPLSTVIQVMPPPSTESVTTQVLMDTLTRSLTTCPTLTPEDNAALLTYLQEMKSKRLRCRRLLDAVTSPSLAFTTLLWHTMSAVQFVQYVHLLSSYQHRDQYFWSVVVPYVCIGRGSPHIMVHETDAKGFVITKRKTKFSPEQLVSILESYAAVGLRCEELFIQIEGMCFEMVEEELRRSHFNGMQRETERGKAILAAVRMYVREIP